MEREPLQTTSDEPAVETAIAGSSDALDNRVAIIGLGYVGLPLGLAFRDAGLEVVGYESDPHRLSSLRDGRSPLDDVSDRQLADALAGGLLLCSPDDDGLSEADAIFICVSTPVTVDNEPDLGPVLAAAGEVTRSLRRGQLVVLQSTTWPGTTVGPVREELERSGLVAGRDFGLAHAPERVNPGDRGHFGSGIPRVVGGLTPADTRRTASLLRRLGGEVLEMSSADAAELAKLHENVFRNVNIALMNQLAVLCERMGLDVWEVIGAVATKPFGFMPFWPGPGVGGHCIPVDPYYLAWRARQFGMADRFIELAADINGSIPDHVADTRRHCTRSRRPEPRWRASRRRRGRVQAQGARRPQRALRRRDGRAWRRGAHVRYHDPHVPGATDTDGNAYESVPLAELLDESDAAVAMVRTTASTGAPCTGARGSSWTP